MNEIVRIARLLDQEQDEDKRAAMRAELRKAIAELESFEMKPRQEEAA